MIKKQMLALAMVAMLSGCGDGGGANSAAGDTKPDVDDPAAAAASRAIDFVRTCDSLRPEVIRTAATNGVTIVKIYDPKTVKKEPKKVSCVGRALVSSGQEATIYYRDFQDEDGDWLIQYSEQQLD